MDKKGFGEQDLDTKSKHLHVVLSCSKGTVLLLLFHINNTHMNIHECSDTKKPFFHFS